MSSIFKDTGFGDLPGLDRFFSRKLFGDFASAITLATAVELGRLSNSANKLHINNQTDKEVFIVLVNPRLDPTVTDNRVVLISVDAASQYAVEATSPPHINIPGGTVIMAYFASAPTSGNLKVFTFPG